jgi:Lrp/AsnC family transcriptional regulator for asnA, asnC and gidA
MRLGMHADADSVSAGDARSAPGPANDLSTPWGPEPGPLTSTEVVLDDVDRRILRLLGDDGRRPYAEMSRAVGVSEATVRKRLDRMVEAGVVRIIAVLNAAATGYPVDAIVGLRVRPDRLRSVGRELAALDEVAYVGYVTGSYDLVFEIITKSSGHLLEFLSDGLAHIDGILSAETFEVLHTEKFSYMRDLADGDGVDGEGGAE